MQRGFDREVTSTRSAVSSNGGSDSRRTASARQRAAVNSRNLCPDLWCWLDVEPGGDRRLASRRSANGTYRQLRRNRIDGRSLAVHPKDRGLRGVRDPVPEPSGAWAAGGDSVTSLCLPADRCWWYVLHVSHHRGRGVGAKPQAEQ